MSRRPLFVLTGLIVLLVLGFAGLWFLTQKRPAPVLDGQAPLAHSDAPSARPLEAAPVEAPQEPGASERALVQKALPAKSGASEAQAPVEADLRNALWVEGRVHFPDGTPADEKLRVEARGKKFANDTLHSVEVGHDGSFRVAFAPGTRTGWLRLKGRYLYLPEDQKVKLPAKEGTPVQNLELAPVLGGWIRGHVSLPLGVSSQGAALAGTRVQAWRTSYSPGDEVNNMRNLSGEIGADERFEIGGVPNQGGWALMLEPECFTRAQKSDVKVEPGKSIEIEIPLKTGARISGQVVDEQGGPVADATFSYQAPNDPDGGWTNFHGKKSAADGAFDLRGTPAAKGTLTVEKDGFLHEPREFSSLSEGTVQEGLRIVLRRGNSIAGVVHWPDGQPVAGASVSLRFAAEQEGTEINWSWGGNDHATRSDGEGKFCFTGLSKGKGALRAEAKAPQPAAEAGVVEAAAKKGEEPAASEKSADAGSDSTVEAKEPTGKDPTAKDPTKESSASRFPKTRKWTAVAGEIEAGTQAVVLTLNAGYSLPGRVVDSAGAPVKEFLVRAEPVEKDRKEWQPVRGALSQRFSDADGRFTLEGLHEGEWQIRAEAKNAPACSPQQVRVPAQSAPLQLTLAAGCTLRGTVVDPKGQPVRSARLRAEPEHEDSNRFVFNGNRRFSTSADAEGNFTIEGIPPGPLHLRASCDEWAEAEPLPFDLAPGQKLEGVRVVMRVPGRIRGIVLDGAGHTDAARPVSLGGGPSGNWQQTTSDSNGRFEFEKLAPGDYTVYTQPKQEEVASAGDNREKASRVYQEQQRTLQVKVEEGATAEVTLGGLPKNALHLVGHVTCGGHAVADAYLQVWKHERSEDEEGRAFQCSAGDDGSYDLVLAGAGEYTINISAGSSSSTFVRFEVKVGADAQQTRDFELPGSHISGRVVDRQGKPLAQVWLQLGADASVRGEGGRNVSGNVGTDADGRFQFEHVGPGTYEIVCGGAEMGWRPGPRIGRTTRSGLKVESGKSIEGLEIVAQPGCRVEGVVLGSDGAPVAGATVLAVDEQGKSLMGWNRATTDGTGHFDFDALPPGRAAFLAEKGQATSGYSSWVTVQDGETTKVDLTLSSGTLLYVSAVDANGAQIDCDMQVFDGRNLDVSNVGMGSEIQAEEQPGRRFGPLAPGKYSVVVMRKDKPDLHQDVSLGGEASKALSVKCD